jgi:hypothetical protein
MPGMLIQGFLVGAEFTLLFLGIPMLLMGRPPYWTQSLREGSMTHVLPPWIARVIGLVAMSPIPLTFAMGKGIPKDSVFWTPNTIEVSAILVCLTGMVVLIRVYRKPIAKMVTTASFEVDEAAGDE